MSAPGQPPATIPINFGTVARGIGRYAILMILFVLTATGIGAAVWTFLPLPNHTGHVLFRLNTQPTSVLQPTGGDSGTDFNTYRSLQAATIRGRHVVVSTLSDPKISGLPMFDRTKVTDPAAWLLANLRVDFPQGHEFMRVTLEGDNPDELLEVMKAVKDVYLRDVVNKDKNSRTVRLESLKGLQRKYEDEMSGYQKQIRNARLDMQAGSDPLTVAYRERMMEAQIAMAQSRLNEVVGSNREGRIGIRMTKADATVLPDLPSDLLNDLLRADPQVQALERQKADLAASYERSAGLASPGSETPKMREAKELIAKVDRELADLPAKRKPEIQAKFKDQLAREYGQTLLSLEQRMRANAEMRKELETDLEKLIAERRKMNVGQIDLDELKTKVTQSQKMTDRLAGEIEMLKPELDAPTRVAQWEDPSVSPGVEGNRRAKYTLMSAGGCLLAGLVLVTWLEYRNRRIQSPEDVTSGTGLKVIGTVPAMSKEAVRRSDGGDWHYQLTESVDMTRTMLLSGPKTTRHILISSAMSGEGKTSLTTHLAVSLARAGLRVLLIDADMRRPAVHKVFGISLKPGLAEVLTDHAVAADVIQVCRVPGLSIIAGGGWTPVAAAALSGQRWDDLIGGVEHDYDFILIDSPPILPVSDALAIARKVDGVVMAVMRDVSRFAAFESARNRLVMVGANIIGVVVSGITTTSYYYDRYYSRPTEPAEPAAQPARV